jgi:RNA polymerase sigma factor (TIGR02999 family)
LPAHPRTVTNLLRQIRAGDVRAQERLFRLVYQDLRRLAQSQINAMRFRGDFEGTSLANAACGRLLEDGVIEAEDRRHFFFLLARAMRDVLIDEIRRGEAARRGGGAATLPLVEMIADRAPADVAWVHEAVDRLLEADPQAGRVVLLRFYAERTIEETAELLDISVAMVRREWDYAKAWLRERFARACG